MNADARALTRQRLAALLAGYARVRVAVVGDFFLDCYLVTDPALAEPSLETGLTARQVVARRSSPGHAGTVANNLRALGVQTIYACGFTGDDGEGFDLRQGLVARGIDVAYLARSAEVVTGTYLKPTALQPDGSEREMERLDVKNRVPLPAALEEAIVAGVERLTAPGSRHVDAVIVADQVEERNCGAITDRVRGALCHLARARPEIVWLADSRRRIGEYRHMFAKPNRDECRRAVEPGERQQFVQAEAQQAALEALQPGLAMELEDLPAGDEQMGMARRLAERTGRTVFLTLGEEGMLVVEPAGVAARVPALLAPRPIDPTGAGDAATAGIVPALAQGAAPLEAAAIGVLVAGLTVRQLGTTGTATPEQVLAAYEEWAG